MMSRWLDYPMSVMWDNLTALQPATVKEAQTVLFLHKLALMRSWFHGN